MKPIAQALEERFFADEGAQVYAILDGASVPGLVPRLAEAPEYVCLYAGELKPDMQEVAPYLIRLERGAAFTAWILEEGWGNHWGVFAASGADLRTLRLHFRRFLIVHDPGGKPLVFRYYDPRVLRTYLPTCNAEELDTVFGPVTHFYAESEDPGELLGFRRADGKLVAGVTALAG